MHSEYTVHLLANQKLKELIGEAEKEAIIKQLKAENRHKTPVSKSKMGSIRLLSFWGPFKNALRANK